MICDQCGRSNDSGLKKCTYCGAEMPVVSAGGGFADILRYNNSYEGTNTYHATPETQEHTYKNISDVAFDLTVQKLVKSSDSILKTTQRNIMLELIGITISFVIVISSIIACIITIRSINSQKNELITQMTEIKKELKEYKNQADVFLSEIEKDNESNNISENEIVNDSETDEQMNNESNIYDEHNGEVKNSSVSLSGIEDNIK